MKRHSRGFYIAELMLSTDYDVCWLSTLSTRRLRSLYLKEVSL